MNLPYHGTVPAAASARQLPICAEKGSPVEIYRVVALEAVNC